jgi:hypothetical protein
MAGHHGEQQVDLADPVALRNLGRAVVALFQKWNLSEEQQLALLGSEAHDGAELYGYRIGERPLPGCPEVLQRVAHIMGIHASLRLLFPENEDLRFSWVRRRNRAFGGAAPIDIMLRDGADGIARVWTVLDQQRMQ